MVKFRENPSIVSRVVRANRNDEVRSRISQWRERP